MHRTHTTNTIDTQNISKSTTKNSLRLEKTANRKRKRRSKLDALYYPIAHALLDNARAKKSGSKKLSLESICRKLERMHGVRVHKSTLSRFIGRRDALGLL